MNELALFAGAGGGILGGQLLGWRTVCAVEWNAYAASVLAQRQNDGLLPPFPIWDDVQTFSGEPWRGAIDVVSGGFPCQDISAAGKGAGIGGERSSMWRHMARIVGEVRPRYVFVENSPMLTLRGLGTVLGDLAALGFDARWGVLSAAAVGAPHRRERIWIVANARSGRRGGEEGREVEQPGRAEAIGTGAAMADTGGARLEGREWSGASDKWLWSSPSGSTAERGRPLLHPPGPADMGRWADVLVTSPDLAPSASFGDLASFAGQVAAMAQAGLVAEAEIEPALRRMADGLALRSRALRLLGNGVHPLAAGHAWRTLSAAHGLRPLDLVAARDGDGAGADEFDMRAAE